MKCVPSVLYSSATLNCAVDTDLLNVKKTKFIKTVIGDVAAHLKPPKFTVSSDL